MLVQLEEIVREIATGVQTDQTEVLFACGELATVFSADCEVDLARLWT